MSTGSLEAGDRAAAAVQKTPNRVTLASMLEKIDTVDFISPLSLPTMIICAMKMKNGFVLVGKSAPADPANFDRLLGQDFAREDCIRQLWQLEGYALRERLAAEGR
ncbi:MAG: hypothetical protein KIS96_14370 [Bauldia sp.]|nr:hypothetical protein [Bauldia sp.]